MPTSLLSADSQFPDLEKTENSKEKFEILSNYLYMLLEQLRYTLGNLGMDNFNESEFIKIGESITEPIYIQLADDDERMNQLQITAEGLSGRISNTEGDVTALQATANGLAARISSAEGNITSLQATSDGLAAQISNAQGDITSLQATAQGLSTRVSSAEGNITTLTQTSNSLTSRVTNAEGQISVVQQTVNGLTVTDASGTTRIKGSSIDTGSLNLTGAITWSDLSSGVQDEIESGITEKQAKTLITSELVSSPNIAGAYYWDINQQMYLEINPNTSGKNYILGGSLDLFVNTNDYDDPEFERMYSIFYSGDSYISFSVFDYCFMRIVDFTTIKPQQTWDFSNATVTGLDLDDVTAVFG